MSQSWKPVTSSVQVTGSCFAIVVVSVMYWFVFCVGTSRHTDTCPE